MKLREIKQFPHTNYTADFGWDGITGFDGWLGSQRNTYIINEEPEYQRGYVWTVEQQSKFIEFVLHGGTSARNIYWNCPNWGNDFTNSEWHNTLELVDGKQRLTAARRFLKNEITAFGLYLNQFEDKDYIRRDMRFNFKFHINCLQTPQEVGWWYLGVNGGTSHTKEDLQRALDYIKKHENGK